MKDKRNIIFDSWHQLYPNRKRKKEKKTYIYKLLDCLIKFGYDKKLYVNSSHQTIIIENILAETKERESAFEKKDCEYLTIKLENFLFTIKEYNKDDSFLNPFFTYKDLTLEKATSIIKRIIDKWLEDLNS